MKIQLNGNPWEIEEGKDRLSYSTVAEKAGYAAVASLFISYTYGKLNYILKPGNDLFIRDGLIISCKIDKTEQDNFVEIPLTKGFDMMNPVEIGVVRIRRDAIPSDVDWVISLGAKISERVDGKVTKYTPFVFGLVSDDDYRSFLALHRFR